MSKKRIVFRNMEHSEAIELYANEHLGRIEKFLENDDAPISIELFLEPSKVHSHHKIELVVKSPRYNRTVGKEGREFYQVLDHVIDVMYRELHEDKRRHVDDLKTAGRHDDFKKQR